MQSVVIQTGTLFGMDAPRNAPHEILEFLNAKTGHGYRPVAVNIDQIKARLKEGATLQECKSIIAMKTREWKNDPVMSKFLRPATLFNRTKFWQYHGQLVQVTE